MMNNKAQSQETFAQPCAKNEHLAELERMGFNKKTVRKHFPTVSLH